MSLRTDLLALGCTSKRGMDSVGFISFYVIPKGSDSEPVETKMYYRKKQEGQVKQLQAAYAGAPVLAFMRPVVTVELIKALDRKFASTARGR